MKRRLKNFAVLGDELRESFMMAANSIASHKLRSALTLLGVLVGVFSIIVVMTAMRAMQNNIEKNLSQIGGETFVIDKWPGFSVKNDARYWRRADITYRQAQEVQKKASLAKYYGMESDFDVAEIISKYGKAAPNVGLEGETIGSFATQNWNIDDGRILEQTDVDGAHNVCVLGGKLAKDLFPFGSPVGQSVKIDSINYSVVGVDRKS